MRHRVKGSGDSPTVKAYAGTTGVLLAMNLPASKRKNLLGFAIERLDVKNNIRDWLKGTIHFQGVNHPPGTPVDSKDAPIQKFRWSDYRVYEGCSYEYRVHACYGTHNDFDLADPTVVKVKTHGLADKQAILFNRAAAASQAFARKFPELNTKINTAKKNKKKDVKLTPEAKEWLSRGALDLILNFIARAGQGEALDIAIYEYEQPDIARAVRDARKRGADVRIVYHAKTGDAQTTENEHTLKGIPKSCLRPRKTSRIFHNKYIVLSKLAANGTRKPQAVLAGSMNFTENGVFRQANVLHVVENAGVAGEFLAAFERLFAGDSPAQSKQWIDANNPIDTTDKLFVGFSPRSGLKDLAEFCRCIDAAKRDVLFCTAFDLHKDLDKSLLGAAHDPILRYGLENRKTSITGFHADRTAAFAATAMLDEGLEGFLKESLAGQKGNILVHTKLVVVDFTGDNPTVISGSHNLSKAASDGNDENFLILRGDTDAADCYGCELMRIYDHYRFRWYVKTHKTDESRGLFTTDKWTDPYYGNQNTLKFRDRVRFAGD